MLKYALVGFGGLGKVHFKNLLQIENERNDIELVAICGADIKESIKNTSSINIGNVSFDNIDFSKYNLYDTYEELFENEKLDFIISALPTTIHKAAAVCALDMGLHVFSEKPMALNLSDCIEMVDCAEKNNKVLMIGQCLRFNNAYNKVKEIITSKRYGSVIRAELKRYSALPMWSVGNWLLDRNKSGGCMLDLHIHDVDIINYFFGMPKSVISHSTHNKVEFESIFTTYEYDDILVTSAADWSFPQTFPFAPSLTILFEHAAAEIKRDDITIYTDEEIIFPELDKEDMFMKELREFISCVCDGKESKISSCRSVLNSMRIVDAEIRSAMEDGSKKVV